MGRTAALLSYKLRFFFSPALRGRAGPLAFVFLILLFLPTGYVVGFGIGMALKSGSPGMAVNLLAAPLAGLLSFGFLYALGSGVTAHVSEFDYFLTGPVRPREFLVADLLFQFVSVLGTGGLAGVVAAFGLVTALGRPLEAALPLFALLAAYGLLVLLLIQVLVVLRVRYPKRPIRSLILVLFVVSLLPSASLARPDFPIRFADLPVPSTAFATLGYAALGGSMPALADVLVPLAYLAAIGAVWYVLSGTYFFHGIRPTLSAGFGQVDMSARMDQQRWLIGRFGRLTKWIGLRTDRGGDTGLMTRFHLIRIWRDGSAVFVVLLIVLSIFPAVMSSGPSASASAGVTQILTLPLAILALNWSYYERDNLWLVLTSRGSVGAYFRGFMLSLAGIGLAASAALLLLVTLSTNKVPPIEDMALPLVAPFTSSIVAAALLTRIKIKPSAFSVAILLLLFLVVLGGFLGGLGVQALLIVSRAALGLAAEVQAVLVLMSIVGVTWFGMWWVTRLAAGFRL